MTGVGRGARYSRCVWIWCYGLVVGRLQITVVLLGGQLDLMTVKVFPNLDDSVILSIKHCVSGLHEDC